MLDYGGSPLQDTPSRYSSNPHGNPFQHRHAVTKGEQSPWASKNPRNGTHIHTHAYRLRVKKGRKDLNEKPPTARATSPCPCATVCIDNMAAIYKCRWQETANVEIGLEPSSFNHSKRKKRKINGEVAVHSAARQVRTPQHPEKNERYTILCGTLY